MKIPLLSIDIKMFFKGYFFNFMSLSAYVYVNHTHALCLQIPEKFQIVRIIVTDNCELLFRGWKWDPVFSRCKMCC